MIRISKYLLRTHNQQAHILSLSQICVLINLLNNAAGNKMWHNYA